MDAEAQRQKDIAALKELLVRRGVPRHAICRCPACDGYMIAGEPCPTCPECVCVCGSSVCDEACAEEVWHPVHYFDRHRPRWGSREDDWFTAIYYTRFTASLRDEYRVDEPLPQEAMDFLFPPPPTSPSDQWGEINPDDELLERYRPHDTNAHQEDYYLCRHPEHGAFVVWTVGGYENYPDRIVWAEVGYDRCVELSRESGIIEQEPAEPCEPEDLFDDFDIRDLDGEE